MRSNGLRQPRYAMRIPLCVRPLDPPGTPPFMVISTNISSTGLYFASETPFSVGTQVEIVLRMPEEVVGKPSREWLCRGRVARVQEHLSGDHVGVGVQFYFYDVVKPILAQRLAG
jgi:hypothetical protein